jgi:hypothetical protein
MTMERVKYTPGPRTTAQLPAGQPNIVPQWLGVGKKWGKTIICSNQHMGKTWKKRISMSYSEPVGYP